MGEELEPEEERAATLTHAFMVVFDGLLEKTEEAMGKEAPTMMPLLYVLLHETISRRTLDWFPNDIKGTEGLMRITRSFVKHYRSDPETVVLEGLMAWHR